MTEVFLRLTGKWPEGATIDALRDIDAVSHKKRRSVCRRVNQRFLNCVCATAANPNHVFKSIALYYTNLSTLL